MIKIRQLSPEHENDYRGFLASIPASMIYYSLEYRNFILKAVGGEPVYLLAFSNGEITGALPLFKAYHPEFGTVINSLPWYGSHGGCIIGAEGGDDARNALLAAYLDIVSDSGVFTATMILSPLEEKGVSLYRDFLKPFACDGRIGQMTPLPPGGDDLENRLLMTCSQKTRNLARKAMKQGFSIMASDEQWAWRFLYDTHQDNILAINGKPKPWEHFAAIRESIPPGMRSIFIAMYEGVPAAALLTMSFNRTVEYITPVIRHEFRSRQPLSFLIFNAMLKAAREGFQWWNWGGTWISQQSLHHFKKGWGAVDMPYSYLINSDERAVNILKEQGSGVSAAFPYYYVFPFDQL
jgi:hypothetical protein